MSAAKDVIRHGRLSRRGRLQAPHDTVQLEVECSLSAPGAFVLVRYWGAEQVLIDARCVPAEYLTGRKRARSTATWGGKRRAPTKAAPDRRLVEWDFRDDSYLDDKVRRVHALDMPGVRELFPEGLPEIQPAPKEKSGPATVAEWRTSMLQFGAHMADFTVQWATVGSAACTRFQLSAADVARLREIAARFKSELCDLFARASVVDTQRPQLRLVKGERL